MVRTDKAFSLESTIKRSSSPASRREIILSSDGFNKGRCNICKSVLEAYTVEQSKDLVFGPLYIASKTLEPIVVDLENEKLFSDKNATTPLKGDQRAEIGMIFIG